ncbi:hypothetical protein DFH11DRAFT_1680717 [Phellopilus nigrolimitatus]|nr:hypothetical protein DFH11DRAFT_1680717 [Phellopilus nigrolimitatus]
MTGELLIPRPHFCCSIRSPTSCTSSILACIWEILTCDGGLERLVRLLHDFCLSPPPPEYLRPIYGLSPPGLPCPPPTPTLNPNSFDRHTAYLFCSHFKA